MYRNTLTLILLVQCLLLPSLSVAEADWDVSDTGQPYTDARFTLEEGTWMSVDVHPNGELVVFDLLGDIYTMPAAGGNATLVHGGPVMVRMPRFSPDGKKILYLSDESGGDNVWVSNLDGSEARQITHETSDVLTNPVWGPGGSYVAATKLSSRFGDLFTSELRIYHRNGGSGRVVVDSPHPNQNVSEAQFSADGRYLYYTHKVGGPKGGSVFVDANHAVHAIMQRDLNTGKTKQLLKGFGGATTVQVSPNGQQLAFVRRVKEKTVLFIHDRDSGEQRPVYDELDRDMQGEWITQGTYYPQYSWFPDGRHIAIWGKGKLYNVDTQRSTATEIPFRVDAQHRITDVARFQSELAPAVLSVKAIRHPVISPNNKTLVFNALGRLWKKRLPAGKPKRLTASAAFEFEPVYSPDGKSIAYVEWDDERGSALQLLTVRSGRVRTVVKNRGVIRQPAFAPDGKSLVYQIQADSKCMGGFGNASGIYHVAASGKARPVQLAKRGGKPGFLPDGQRIYYQLNGLADGARARKIVSVNLDGYDKREHVVMVSRDRSELTVSPDFQWVGFKERQEYYAMPLVDAGGAMTVFADKSVTPAIHLTDGGGYNLMWSANSSKAYWMRGNTLVGFSLKSQQYDKPLTVDLKVNSDIAQGIIAFTNARLITITDGVIENGTLLVENNRIVAVGDSSDVVIPEDAKIMDSTGKTIMPGLINMHGHVDSCYYESTGAIPQKQASLYASLAFGITTNFDPYSSELASYSASEMQISGDIVSPRLITVGGVIYGRPGKSDPVYTAIDDLADATKVMARKNALGGKTLKSYRQPLRRQRQQLVKAARNAGIMVSVEGESHFYNNLSAVLDGHNTLEHNLPIANYYDDVVQLFAHGQTANTPTLVATFGEIMGENYIYQTTRSWEDPRIDSYIPEVTSGYSPLGLQYAAPLYARAMTCVHVSNELWDIGFRAVSRSTKKLDDAGVLVNVGSHSQVQGMAMHWEMKLFSEGGMSEARILRAATINGAITLGLDKDIGSLTVGKLADLIVLEKNPLDNILHTETVVQTMIGGRLYDSLSMNEIGNYNRPRTKFYWEQLDTKNTGWNNAAAGQ